jgi:hypothetical protein
MITFLSARQAMGQRPNEYSRQNKRNKSMDSKNRYRENNKHNSHGQNGEWPIGPGSF